MNIRPDQLAASLAKPLAPLWLLHGNEPLLVIEAADAIRAAARTQGYDERETLVVGQGFKWDALTLAAGNMSLFGGAKLIDLRIPTGKPGREGGDALQRYVADLPAQTLTLITLPEVDWATRKTAWFKALSESAATLELNAPERERLPEWVGRRLAAQQQSATPEALAFIAEHVEGNLLAAHQEILKLGLLHGAGSLSLEQVQDAVLNVARYDIDKLRLAVVEGDPARCARLLEGLKGEGAAAPLVLWALANETRTLASLCAARDTGQALPAVFKAERIFEPRRQQALGRALGRLSQGGLRAALMHAARIDRMIKGLASGDVWDEFLQLALRLAGRH
ncbi:MULTISPECIES: DNA polymerase III subunit delta [unclassified Thauera]|uniref:DNA polymerase III subunit delta n=1 Tax=unclassified Thauera TaxID=2609274 RepID=UPI0002CEEFC4|nr:MULTISPECIES: DNA polymerase III subunit delta [unclassified Thauera]ENO94393.1 DNA polymerase III subunit delta [Thauera sp. 28]WBL63273.1 DNA polymerase III subunit delta [Thauera sp. WB-2]HAG76634.1 DNA polymerase III subunit delta [Thauera sp.]HNR60010.1 DNA polymerase III subunit delta [Thauera sp.]HNS91587.1 DNA polymerase III subunit delta [Thauera sp.]